MMNSKSIELRLEELRLLSNYANPIPITRGETRKFMEEKYPGWDWNDLIPKLLQAGFLTTTPEENDIKLLQGLWLKSSIERVVATKSNGQVSFEV